MVIFASNLTVIIRLCCTPEKLSPWISNNMFQTFDLDIDVWHWPTTFDVESKHPQNQGHRSNGLAVRGDADGQTDTWTQATKCIISMISQIYAVDKNKFCCLPFPTCRWVRIDEYEWSNLYGGNIYCADWVPNIMKKIELFGPVVKYGGKPRSSKSCTQKFVLWDALIYYVLLSSDKCTVEFP